MDNELTKLVTIEQTPEEVFESYIPFFREHFLDQFKNLPPNAIVNMVTIKMHYLNGDKPDDN